MIKLLLLKRKILENRKIDFVFISIEKVNEMKFSKYIYKYHCLKKVTTKFLLLKRKILENGNIDFVFTSRMTHKL